MVDKKILDAVKSYGGDFEGFIQLVTDNYLSFYNSIQSRIEAIHNEMAEIDADGDDMLTLQEIILERMGGYRCNDSKTYNLISVCRRKLPEEDGSGTEDEYMQRMQTAAMADPDLADALMRLGILYYRVNLLYR